MEDALLAGEVLVDAVAEFVGERLHVADAAGEVHQDVRVRARDRAVAERPAPLALGDGRIDPAAVEELLGDGAHLRVERGVRVEHGVARLIPAEVPLDLADGRVAVVVHHLVEPEQAALEPVEPLGEVVPVRHRIDERLHRGVGDLVVEVARGEPVRVVPEPVGRGLIGEDGVEDERERAGEC